MHGVRVMRLLSTAIGLALAGGVVTRGQAPAPAPAATPAASDPVRGTPRTKDPAAPAPAHTTPASRTFICSNASHRICAS